MNIKKMTKSEKKAFHIGCKVGARNVKLSKKQPTNIKPFKKIYIDTNTNMPIDEKKLQIIAREYKGKNLDEKVKNYILHMQRKYGKFDKNGKFIGLL